MRFATIDKYIFFGGGELMRRFLGEYHNHIGKRENLFVITSSRHAEEQGREDGRLFKDFLRDSKIPFSVTDDINSPDVLDQISEKTLGISISSAWIFKEDFIQKFKGQLVNIHGAPLPQHKGGGGFSWRIMMGIRKDGSTLHIIDPGVDTGDIILQNAYEYPDSCRIPLDYESYALSRQVLLLINFLKGVRDGRDFQLIQQDASVGSYWPRLATDKHGYINWDWPSSDIERFICAFDDPYSGAISFWNGQLVRIKKCFSVVGDFNFHPFQTGIVYHIYKDTISIAARGGSILIKTVLDNNSQSLLGKIKLGDRMYTPRKYLDESTAFRAIYNAKGLKS